MAAVADPRVASSDLSRLRARITSAFCETVCSLAYGLTPTLRKTSVAVASITRLLRGGPRSYQGTGRRRTGEMAQSGQHTLIWIACCLNVSSEHFT